MIAYNSEFVYFVVVDGWNLNQSEGMTFAELSNFLVSQLQVTDAVTLDGGGSSTFVVYGTIINNTYCNFTRNCGIHPIDRTPPLPTLHLSWRPLWNIFLLSVNRTESGYSRPQNSLTAYPGTVSRNRVLPS